MLLNENYNVERRGNMIPSYRMGIFLWVTGVFRLFYIANRS